MVKRLVEVRERWLVRWVLRGLWNSSLCAVAFILACDTRTPTDPLIECDIELGGACWVNLGLENFHVTTLEDTDWGVFAGTWQGGLFRLSDDGSGWSQLGIASRHVTSTLFLPGASSRLLVGTRTHPETPSTSDTIIYATHDAGMTWTRADNGFDPPGLVGQAVWSLARDPSVPSRLYAGSSLPILRSDDGGEHWHFVLFNDDVFGNGVRDIVVSPNEDGRIWAGVQDGLGRGAIWRSQDWGASWTFTKFDSPFGFNAVLDLTIDTTGENIIWAGTPFGVLFSDDGGDTWLVSRPDIYGSALEVVGDTLVVASAYRDWGDPETRESGLGLFLRTDEQWTRLETPESLDAATSLTVGASHELMIGTVRTGVWKVTFLGDPE